MNAEAWARRQKEIAQESAAQPSADDAPVTLPDNDGHPNWRYLFKHFCAHAGIELGKDDVAECLRKFAALRAPPADARDAEDARRFRMIRDKELWPHMTNAWVNGGNAGVQREIEHIDRAMGGE